MIESNTQYCFSHVHGYRVRPLARLNDNAVAGARYQYLNRLVSDSNQHLNTTETTLGIGWRF
jgi:hypothetical protein